MDKLTLENTRDLPMTTNTLAFMQAAYKMFEQFGFLGGENVIVSGCEVTGSSAAPGYMFLQGQLMPFVGGTIQTNVKIVTVVTDVTVDIGSRQQTSYRAEFGTSTNPAENVVWADIVKLDDIKTIMSHLVTNSALITSNTNRLDDLDIDSGALQVTVSVPEITASTNQVRRIGKLVNISLRFTLTSALTGGAIELMKLPASIPNPPLRQFKNAITGTYGNNDIVDSQLFALYETDGTIRAVSVNNVLVNREYLLEFQYFI